MSEQNQVNVNSAADAQSLLNAVLCVNHERDSIPVRLPSGGKAILDLPRPFTVADATHICAWVVQYVEGEKADEARESVAEQLTHNV